MDMGKEVYAQKTDFLRLFGKKSCGMCQDELDARENELLTGKSQSF